MDPVAIDIMKRIKKLLDPNNILNPGKIWEESPDENQT
jgi:FAD/FMN-containing dehydrogenase